MMKLLSIILVVFLVGSVIASDGDPRLNEAQSNIDEVVKFIKGEDASDQAEIAADAKIYEDALLKLSTAKAAQEKEVEKLEATLKPILKSVAAKKSTRKSARRELEATKDYIEKMENKIINEDNNIAARKQDIEDLDAALKEQAKLVEDMKAQLATMASSDLAAATAKYNAAASVINKYKTVRVAAVTAAKELSKTAVQEAEKAGWSNFCEKTECNECMARGLAEWAAQLQDSSESIKGQSGFSFMSLGWKAWDNYWRRRRHNKGFNTKDLEKASKIVAAQNAKWASYDSERGAYIDNMKDRANTKFVKERKKLNQAIAQLVSRRDWLLSEITSKSEECAALSDAIAAVKAETESIDNTDELVEKLNSKADAVAELKAQIAAIKKDCADLRAKMKSLKAERKKLQAQLKSIGELTQDLVASQEDERSMTEGTFKALQGGSKDHGLASRFHHILAKLEGDFENGCNVCVNPCVHNALLESQKALISHLTEIESMMGGVKAEA